MDLRKNTDTELAETIAAYTKYGNQKAAADSLGIAPSSFSDRYKRAQQAAAEGRLGFAPVLPGFEIKSTSTQLGPKGEMKGTSVKQMKAPGPVFEMPPGLALKGVTALLDAEGRILHQHVMGRPGARDPQALVDGIAAAFKKFKPAAKASKQPANVDAKLLTLIPCNDWHIGMFAWGHEVDFNWDVKIAERVIGTAIEDVISRAPCSARAVILGGGDLLHANTGENTTAKSGNVLDVDGRYQKVVDMACRLMVRTADAALRRHKHLTIRILKGNHDEEACVAIAYFLSAWYRNDKRVTVDLDPSLFYFEQFGITMLAATHGHLAKLRDLPSIMAARRPEMWGVTRARYAHGFHVHHKEKLATELNGCICEAHQAPIPCDSWHYGKGFLSGRSVQAITYHKEVGEFSRVNAMILDSVERE